MLDKKYNATEKESKWSNYWKENGIYDFKPDHRKVFSIDTPPPTVSGSIHIGHVFSYTQTEMMARYKRLRGYNILHIFCTCKIYSSFILSSSTYSKGTF